MAQEIGIALIGYGEVGHIFGRELRASGKARVTVYDILFDQPRTAKAMLADARRDGLIAMGSAAEAAANARFVISAVTASVAGQVAWEAARYLKPGQVFVDINSASPGTKKAAAEAVNPVGADYVECAVMAPVPGPGLRVPILAGGPQAAATSETLNALGMAITPVATDYGRASAMKLCRSIMIKGIEALIVDSAKAAGEWDVRKEVFASLDASFPGVKFEDLARYMAQRVNQHGVRRAAEMREAAMMLDDLGIDGSLSRAVADAQERGAGKA
jgi:3-hydroxyisobutyrate dehydrogenase-like beta-hydroxyacid dehydrogenase